MTMSTSNFVRASLVPRSLSNAALAYAAVPLRQAAACHVCDASRSPAGVCDCGHLCLELLQSNGADDGAGAAVACLRFRNHVVEQPFAQYLTPFLYVQGKWVLEETAGAEGTPATRLHYAVEMIIKAGPSRALGLIEPLVERCLAEVRAPVCMHAYAVSACAGVHSAPDFWCACRAACGRGLW